MKKKIDMKQFELTKDDMKQMKSIDEKTLSDPNYQKNKKVNLEYYAEDELDDIGSHLTSSISRIAPRRY